LELAIGNAVLSLLQHPDQLAILKERPELVRDAIEELLRYETPTQALPWFAAVDAELGGVTIPAGHKVIVMTGAANRDPAVFEDPDQLDVRRPARRHLAFGSGVHSCLGAALARRELDLVLTYLLTRFNGFDYWPRQVQLDSGFMHRGVKFLPMAVR
jgi:cytochrome P450